MRGACPYPVLYRMRFLQFLAVPVTPTSIQDLTAISMFWVPSQLVLYLSLFLLSLRKTAQTLN